MSVVYIYSHFYDLHWLKPLLNFIFQFINGDDVLLDQIENMPSLDVPCLRKPRFGGLAGPIDQYNRKRYLDMTALSQNLVLTKRLLEDSENNWSKNGIPLAWKVLILTNLDRHIRQNVTLASIVKASRRS